MLQVYVPIQYNTCSNDSWLLGVMFVCTLHFQYLLEIPYCVKVENLNAWEESS